VPFHRLPIMLVRRPDRQSGPALVDGKVPPVRSPAARPGRGTARSTGFPVACATHTVAVAGNTSVVATGPGVPGTTRGCGMRH